MHYSTCQKVFFQFIPRNFRRVRGAFVLRGASGAERDGGWKKKKKRKKRERRVEKNWHRHYALKVAPGELFHVKRKTHFSLNHRLRLLKTQ